MTTAHSDTKMHAAVRRGLDELKPALTAFVNRQMSRALPGKAFAVSGDVPAIIKVILDNWDLAFASVLPRGVRNYLHEVRDVRNRWAHDELFSEDDARRALDTMQLVAKAIGAGPVIMQLVQSSPTQPTKIFKAPIVGAPKPAAGGGGNFDTLHERFVAAANGAQPVIASYSWIYGRINGGVPKPWSQAYGNQVSRQAAHTRPRVVNGLGPVALDTFIVSTTTRMPSDGYWPKAGHGRDAWDRVLGRAMLLHGDAKAPWE